MAGRSGRRRWIGMIVDAVGALVPAAAILAMAAFSSVMEVDSNSMANTMCSGDYVLADATGFLRVAAAALPGRNVANRGDIVVLREPGQPRRSSAPELIVKRVIAVGGDHVRVHRGKVFVNGTSIHEPYVSQSHAQAPEFWPNDVEGAGVRDVQIAPGRVFVMGDNRSDSRDSRVFGSVSDDQIVGKVIAVFSRGRGGPCQETTSL
jgi:signal peptidase I